MESDVLQRINLLLRVKKDSIQKLANVVNMNKATLAGKLNGTRGMDLDTLCRIVEAYPTLSAEWLLKGVGNMEISNAPDDPEIRAVCIDQAKEIFRLKQRIAELEGEKKDRA